MRLAQPQLLAQLGAVDHPPLMQHQPLLHRGLGFARRLGRHQRADLHAAGRRVGELFASEAGPLAQQGAEHRALLARQRLQHRKALAGSQGNLQLGAGGAVAAGGDQGVAAHGFFQLLQVGPVLRQRTGFDFDPLELGPLRQVHEGGGGEHQALGALALCAAGGSTRAQGTITAAEAVGIHQAGAHPYRQGGAGEEVFVFAAAAVVVEVLVRQAQVGQIALAKGGAIH